MYGVEQKSYRSFQRMNLIEKLSYSIWRSIAPCSCSLWLHVVIGFSSVIEHYLFLSNSYVIVLTSYKIANQLKRVLDKLRFLLNYKLQNIKKVQQNCNKFTVEPLYNGHLVEYQNTWIKPSIIPKIILKLKIKLKLRKTRYTLDPKLVVREYSTPNFKLKNTVHLKLNTPICCIPWAKPWPTLIDVSWPKLMNYDNHETTTKDFLKSQLSIAIDF